MSTSTHPFSTNMDYEDHVPLSAQQTQRLWAAFAGLVMCLIAGYWNMFVYTSSFWQQGLYSHGWIIPLFAVFLLHARAGVDLKLSHRELIAAALVMLASVGLFSLSLSSERAASSALVLAGVLLLTGLVCYHLRGAQLMQVTAGVRWAGVGVLGVSLLVRLVAAYYDMNPLDRLSFIGALLGCCVLVGGPALLRWAGPPLAFLVFMFPLPSVLERNVLLKLQGLAALASTWTLQLLGCPATRDGNKLLVDQIPLDVADACSGLRMATIFGAMSVALAILMVERPWWDRVTILISAIPVALVTNVIRITGTALLYMFFPESKGLQHLVHDWAGLAMMPIAMGILWLELEILRKISVPMDTDDYAVLESF